MHRVLLFLFALLCICSANKWKRGFKCPSGCSCTKETIMCVGTSHVPRTVPSDVNSLSIVNGSIAEIPEGMFSLMPSLQLLLLNANSLTTIKDDAFHGLPHLEYLFIEGNKIETISKKAFRGLRDLTHLSLANNKMVSLPRDLFFDLDSLLELDLRGNAFQCNCENKWLMTWLKNTNATVSDVFCAGPSDMKGKRLNDIPIGEGQCMSTDFVRHQSIPIQSMSADIFSFKEDIYVAMAAPNSNSCVVMEWDHIEMNFRKFDNITGKSVVGCKSVLVDEHVLIIVTQLFGGSHIYRFDDQQNKFTKFQTIEVLNISKPNDIEVFRMDGEWYFVIVDSSKAGLSTLYKWTEQPDQNQTGFYTYQFLHEWFRDTDAEYVEMDGKSYLILASRSQSPVIYLWNKSTLKFMLHNEFPNADDVVAVKSFRLENELYLAMTCYIGDSKILKWTSKQFTEMQALPSRGAMVLQPLSFSNRHYLALGSDYSFTQIYLWDTETKTFQKFKDIYVQSPRSFSPVTTDRRNFIFSSSFKGKSMVFEHVVVDLSL
ncbi:leucine-rich repeat LGI family member 2-like [Corythoichthys intestinalis]|uniref:leucine-rich repeat LGI family member 2-like n=1 Tax=Corythoichthys intestinalis TaxID=161448 RepID=UPI0025A5BCC8|nr:leucine-rich repeat LGI family member 2-like [Corythoichthys intestinalis]XP_061791631.1 leucine-rich repeat LGI family member 2-like [Nerophis lumbriciformis]